MTKKNRTMLIVLGALLFVAAAVRFLSGIAASDPPPSKGAYYYTGPMHGKGNRNTYATEDGKIVPAPVAGSDASGGR